MTSLRPLLGLGLTLGMLAGCPSGAPAPADKQAAAQKPAAAADAGKVADEAAGHGHGHEHEHEAGADHGHAHADDGAGPHHDEGCIYVDGEKGSDELECPHPPPAGGEAAEPDAPPNGEGHYGAKFAIADDPTPLSQLLANAGDRPEADPVLVSGEVEAVCQKKGCWMVIKDGADSARVLMKDHAFAVPMDCRGKKVQVEGTLATRTFTEKQVKHLEKDGGGNPEKVSGDRTENVLTATGINIQS